ncbi:MAG: hypothetical protein IJH65_08245 [Methanobrevibacter sp.]|nr:hypothetical protein [Methanobrevibacter sp.]
MNLDEAKQLLKKNGYIVKEGAFGDWAARTFKGETLLGQEMNRMDDKLANHFAGLLSLQMSRAAAKLKNDKYFVNDLILKCNKLARQFRSAAKSDDDMVSGTFQLQTLLATSFHRIMEELKQYDSRININAKVFDANVPSAECKELAKEYGKVNEAKQLLSKNGYKLIKEAATLPGMNIDCEFEGTYDYDVENGELPHPYVIVSTENPKYINLIKTYFVDDTSLWQDTVVTDVFENDKTSFEFVMPETDFCDAGQRAEYEDVVRDLIFKAIHKANAERIAAAKARMRH